MRKARRSRPIPALAALAVGLLLRGTAVEAGDLPPSQVSGVPIPEGRIDRAIASLDALGAEIMASSGIPGMAVAVVRDGRTAFAKGFGVRQAGAPDPVDADTVFQLASVSKPLAATVIAHQIGIGSLSWDSPVVRYLPWFRLNDRWVTAHVTVGDLLTHRSGLPSHAGDELEDLGYDRRQVLERLHLLPLAPFRASYAYTNFGFTAAAEAVAAAAGIDWATLSEQALYQPLGMSSTSSRYSDFLKRSNRAVGHIRTGGAFQPKYQRQPDAQSPAGGASSSANDLARWLIMLLHNGSFQGQQIVDAAALLPAMTAQMVSSPPSTPDSRPSLYGYGFGVGVTPAGRTVITHSGGFAMGAGTRIELLPSVGVAIVVLTNAWPTGAAEALAASFTDLVQFGTVRRDWLAAYARLMAPLIAPQGSLVGQPPLPERVAPADISPYLGTYGNEYYGAARIERREDRLVLGLGPVGIAYPLRPWDGDAFVFNPSSENQPDGSISLVTFRSKARGHFRSVTIEYLDANGMGTFVRR
ncbi:MAG: serine hydrolase [Azospirillum sp.]|nr:serine hydrolase [Azospirillum sp.]